MSNDESIQREINQIELPDDIGDRDRRTTLDSEKSIVSIVSTIVIPQEEVAIEAENPDEHAQTWTNKREYILALVGVITDVWRFPYLISKNGGLAFLIPCILFVIFCGVPIYLLELAIGQRMRKGPIGTWNAVSPYLTGLGVTSCCICVLVVTYYNIISAWCISYIVWSFQLKLPWGECEAHNRTRDLMVYKKIGNSTNIVVGEEKIMNISRPIYECELAGPAKYFWFRETLNISEGIFHFGDWNWYMTLWIVIAWVLVYLCLIKGTKSSGKVAVVTASFPFIVLFAFLIGGLFLEDFFEGFVIFIKPKWGRLYDGKVWLDAGTQIFYCLSLGFGMCVTFASYNPIQNNVNFDALIIPFLSLMTSMFVSSVMFMILGFKGMKEYKQCLKSRTNIVNKLIDVNQTLWADFYSKNYTLESINFPTDHFISSLNVTLKDVNGTRTTTHLWGSDDNEDNLIYAKHCDKEAIIRRTGSGTGLVFITFAEAVVAFPLGQLWSIIFFVMIMTLQIEGAFGITTCITSCIIDLKYFKCKNWIIVLLTNGFFLVLGVLLFSSGNGIYILTFIDELCIGWPLMISALLECISISYIYGLDRFAYELKLMTGHRPNSFILLCWKFFAPISIFLILIVSIISECQGHVKYANWRKDLGMNEWIPWPILIIVGSALIDLIIIGWIPVLAIAAYFGYRLLHDAAVAFPDKKLRDLRNYDEDRDKRKTNRLQLALMARSFKQSGQILFSSKNSSNKNNDNDNDDLPIVNLKSPDDADQFNDDLSYKNVDT